MSSGYPYLMMDGEIVPYDDATIHILSPAVKYAAVAFEGLRGYWNESEEQLFLFRSPEHQARLLQSARLMGMEEPGYSIDKLNELSLQLLRANEIREDVHIRPLLMVGGTGAMLARGPVVLGMGVVSGAQIIPREDKPFRVTVSSWQRISDNSLSPRIKTSANYQAARMALMQAHEDGYQGALMLDHDGHVTEETRACLFMIRNGLPVTPPVSSDILESVTRDTLIQLFDEHLGLHVEQRAIDRTELYLADELFLCGTGMEVQSVAVVDRFQIGDGKPGPATVGLLEHYQSIARGVSDAHGEWLTPVYD